MNLLGKGNYGRGGLRQVGESEFAEGGVREGRGLFPEEGGEDQGECWWG